MVTQRSAVLNKNVLTQAEMLIALRTIAPQDREAIDAWINVHGTPDQRKTMLDSLASLPIGEAWFWSPGWLDLFRRIKVRRRETFDSSATPKIGEMRRQPKQLAAIDLERLRAAMAETIKRAASDDPVALRRQIADLKGEVERLRHTEPQNVDAIVGMALDRQLGAIVWQLEQHASGLRASFERLRVAVDEFGKYVGIFGQPALAVQPAEKKFRDSQIGKAAGFGPATAGSSPAPGSNSRSGVAQQAERPTVNRMAAGSSPAAGAIRSRTDAELGAGEFRVLTAIAQHRDGVQREQLTILTAYKRSSRDTYIQRLRTQGLVDSTPDGRIVVTALGAAALGPDFQPLPTGDRLREYYLRTLSGGERAILAALCEAYPRYLRRDELDARTGYQRSSRDTYLQRLRARQLVEQSSEGVRASESLFDG
jgi:hypothetical protein